jgi:hypothetical protein
VLSQHSIIATCRQGINADWLCAKAIRSPLWFPRGDLRFAVLCEQEIQSFRTEIIDGAVLLGGHELQLPAHRIWLVHRDSPLAFA